jgi:hypothetical protein
MNRLPTSLVRSALKQVSLLMLEKNCLHLGMVKTMNQVLEG